MRARAPSRPPPAACPSTATYSPTYNSPACLGPAVEVCDSEALDYGVGGPNVDYHVLDNFTIVNSCPFVTEQRSHDYTGTLGSNYYDYADAFVGTTCRDYGSSYPAYVFRVVVKSATPGTPITAGSQITISMSYLRGLAAWGNVDDFELYYLMELVDWGDDPAQPNPTVISPVDIQCSGQPPVAMPGTTQVCWCCYGHDEFKGYHSDINTTDPSTWPASSVTVSMTVTLPE